MMIDMPHKEAQERIPEPRDKNDGHGFSVSIRTKNNIIPIMAVRIENTRKVPIVKDFMSMIGVRLEFSPLDSGGLTMQS